MLKGDNISLQIFSMNEKVDQTVKKFQNKLKETEKEWELRDGRKYNDTLEKLLEEWKKDARKADHLFKETEKAIGKNLTCYECIIRGSNCFPKCIKTIET